MGRAPAADGNFDPLALHLESDRDRLVKSLGVEVDADLTMRAEGLDATRQGRAGSENPDIDFLDAHGRPRMKSKQYVSPIELHVNPPEHRHRRIRFVIRPTGPGAGAAGSALFGMNPEGAGDVDKFKCFQHTRAQQTIF
jgi:hypothetical protein